VPIGRQTLCSNTELPARPARLTNGSLVLSGRVAQRLDFIA